MNSDKKNIVKIINDMPKVELHLHLEGAFTFEFLFKLVNKYGSDEINSIDELKAFFTFKDFSHFIKTWHWKNKFFREAEDFEESTYTALKKLSEENIIYVEAFYSPWDFVMNGISAEEITEATLSGIKKAENDFGIKCNLIVDIVRDYGPDDAVKRLLQLKSYFNNGIIGLGLGGNEKDFPPELFVDVFKKADELGLHLVAHAGEAAGPGSICSAIENLNVERIGHGVRAVEDPELVDKLIISQTPLEICITSNICTKIFESPEQHPVKYFYDRGLFLIINSDDPAMFGSTLTEEFLLLSERLNFSLIDLRKLSLNAVNASFATGLEKMELKSFIIDFWNEKI